MTKNHIVKKISKKVFHIHVFVDIQIKDLIGYPRYLLMYHEKTGALGLAFNIEGRVIVNILDFKKLKSEKIYNNEQFSEKSFFKILLEGDDGVRTLNVPMSLMSQFLNKYISKSLKVGSTYYDPDFFDNFTAEELMDFAIPEQQA